MVRVGGADEARVCNVGGIRQRLETLAHTVAQRTRLDALRLGDSLHLHSVLVRAGGELRTGRGGVHVARRPRPAAGAQPLVPAQDVCEHVRVQVPDMRLGIHVKDRRRDIVRLARRPAAAGDTPQRPAAARRASSHDAPHGRKPPRPIDGRARRAWENRGARRSGARGAARRAMAPGDTGSRSGARRGATPRVYEAAGGGGCTAAATAERSMRGATPPAHARPTAARRTRATRTWAARRRCMCHRRTPVRRARGSAAAACSAPRVTRSWARARGSLSRTRSARRTGACRRAQCPRVRRRPAPASECSARTGTGRGTPRAASGAGIRSLCEQRHVPTVCAMTHSFSSTSSVRTWSSGPSGDFFSKCSSACARQAGTRCCSCKRRSLIFSRRRRSMTEWSVLRCGARARRFGGGGESCTIFFSAAAMADLRVRCPMVEGMGTGGGPHAPPTPRPYLLGCRDPRGSPF